MCPRWGYEKEVEQQIKNFESPFGLLGFNINDLAGVGVLVQMDGEVTNGAETMEAPVDVFRHLFLDRIDLFFEVGACCRKVALKNLLQASASQGRRCSWAAVKHERTLVIVAGDGFGNYGRGHPSGPWPHA